MAGVVLPARSPGIALAGILRALFSGGRSRLYVLQRAGRSDGTALDRHNASVVSFRLQASARNHACLSIARLQRTTQRLSARDRAACPETSGLTHSAPAFFRAEIRQASAAHFSGATAARLSLRHRVPTCRLASPTHHSFARKTSRLLGLGGHQSPERAESRAIRIPSAHHRFPLSSPARRLRDEVRARRRTHASLRKIALETGGGARKLVAQDRETPGRCARRLGIRE
ncbi:MAG: hypothetical protein QOI04_817 [Verrucomicrobiota bacterium]